jgi:hypothetical protein
MTQDDCNPHGIPRPLIVNGETVLTCCECLDMFTSSCGDISDADHLFRCYECRDAAEEWQKDTQGRWGRVPKAGKTETVEPGEWSAGECWKCRAVVHTAHTLCMECLTQQ